MLKNHKIISILLTAVIALGMIAIPASKVNAEAEFELKGFAHIENVGDQWGTVNSDGALVLGTRGLSRRIEAFGIDLKNNSGVSGNLQYRAHIQNIGWTDWANAGTPIGTVGRSLRIEAVEFRLTGALANYYSVVYRAHVQNYGDAQGWVYNGAVAGTEGKSLRVEEIQVKIIPTSQVQTNPSVNYRTHVQNIGWQDWRSDGSVSGTTGRSLRVESIQIKLSDGCDGGVVYKAHCQNVGWQNPVADGATAGTTGSSLRLEAIEIVLSGNTRCRTYPSRNATAARSATVTTSTERSA